MNIIISSLNDIKATATENNDIDALHLFVAKSILSNGLTVDAMTFTLAQDNSTFYLWPEAQVSLNKTNYYAYRLVTNWSIPEGAYTFTAKIADSELTLAINLTDIRKVLQDEHEAILVNGRTINAITTQIVAQDQNSQQFTFYMKRRYDGINLFDPDLKQLSVDYIPVLASDRTNADGELLSFISDYIPLDCIYGDTDDETIVPPDGKRGEWIMFKWNLPYLATKTAGTVRFDIAVTEKNDADAYTWQTLPASFTVSANLGAREESGTEVEKNSTTITEMNNRITAIEESDIYNLDVDDLSTVLDESRDGAVVIGGGGAPIGGAE